MDVLDSTFSFIPHPAEPCEILDMGQSSWGLSRLGTWAKCSRLYELNYVNKPLSTSVEAPWFVRGSALHVAFSHVWLRSNGLFQYAVPESAWRLYLSNNHPAHPKVLGIVDACERLWPNVETFVEREMLPDCIVDLKTSSSNHRSVHFKVQNSRQFALFSKLAPQFAEKYGVESVTFGVVSAQFLKKKFAAPKFEYVVPNPHLVEALDQYIDYMTAGIATRETQPVLDMFVCSSDIPGASCQHMALCFGWPEPK